jgi:hypothetical protein
MSAALRARLTGGSVALLCAAIVTARAATVPSLPAPRPLTATERRELAELLAVQEPGWRLGAERLFPGDHWSQDDDFFNQEHRAVRRLAGERGTSPSDVLRGIDEQLRAAPAGRKVTASPNKPRPFYD